MCVDNRPFDDQSQPRIMIETQIFIMMLVMERIDNIRIAFYNIIDFVSREVFKI